MINIPKSVATCGCPVNDAPCPGELSVIQMDQESVRVYCAIDDEHRPADESMQAVAKYLLKVPVFDSN